GWEQHNAASSEAGSGDEYGMRGDGGDGGDGGVATHSLVSNGSVSSSDGT
ncbi:hypothetical protein Tco_0301418, partial [Tanacetum coccineum]